jgi:hypothetical protein
MEERRMHGVGLIELAFLLSRILRDYLGGKIRDMYMYICMWVEEGEHHPKKANLIKGKQMRIFMLIFGIC